MQLIMNSEEGPKGDPVFALPVNASYPWSLSQSEVGTTTVLCDLEKATLFIGHFTRSE